MNTQSNKNLDSLILQAANVVLVFFFTTLDYGWGITMLVRVVFRRSVPG